MTVILLKQPDLNSEGVQVEHYNYLLAPSFQSQVQAVYSQFTPARNATNKICRGLRWGILINDKVEWSINDEYQLSAKLNPEEKGRARQIDLIPLSFLEMKEIQYLIRDVFKKYYPTESSHKQAFVIQVSGLRYQPTISTTCYPAPDKPHQDGFDNAIVVLSRTSNLLGGMSRVYTIDEEPIYETDLSPGDGLFVKDDQWKHQVMPMIYSGNAEKANSPCYRDIIIIRINPVKR